MSINIQTASGLKKISDSITKQKIINTLGYTPISQDDMNTHTSNTNIHVTTEDRAKWNAKSDFSGDYNDLNNRPNISDDGSDKYMIADKSGNVIAFIDANGIHSVDMTIDGVSLKDKIAELENKPDFSGDYNDLTNKPNILEDGSDSLYIADPNGNIIFKIGSDGLYTTDVVVEGTSLLQVIELLNTHVADTTAHVTADDRAKWDAKSDFSGSYNDLTDTPNVVDDGSDNYTLQDKDGNVIFRVDSEGAHTTALSLNGEDVETKISTHTENSDIHVTPEEKNKWNTHVETGDIHVTPEEKEVWNNRSDFSGSYKDLTDVPSDLVTTSDLTNAIQPVTETLNTHTNNNDVHVTPDEKSVWNAKSDFSGDYNDLNNKPNISDDGSDVYNITDKDGNVIASFSADGLRTTVVMVDELFVDGQTVVTEEYINEVITPITDEEILSLFEEN